MDLRVLIVQNDIDFDGIDGMIVREPVQEREEQSVIKNGEYLRELQL